MNLGNVHLIRIFKRQVSVVTSAGNTDASLAISSFVKGRPEGVMELAEGGLPIVDLRTIDKETIDRSGRLIPMGSLLSEPPPYSPFSRVPPAFYASFVRRMGATCYNLPDIKISEKMFRKTFEYETNQFNNLISGKPMDHSDIDININSDWVYGPQDLDLDAEDAPEWQSVANQIREFAIGYNGRSEMRTFWYAYGFVMSQLLLLSGNKELTLPYGGSLSLYIQELRSHMKRYYSECEPLCEKIILLLQTLSTEE